MAFADMEGLRAYAACFAEGSACCPHCMDRPVVDLTQMVQASDPSEPTQKPVVALVEWADAGPARPSKFRALTDSPHLATVVGVLGGGGAACWYAGSTLFPGPLAVVGASLVGVAAALGLASLRRTEKGDAPDAFVASDQLPTLSKRILLQRQMEADAAAQPVRGSVEAVWQTTLEAPTASQGDPLPTPA